MIDKSEISEIYTRYFDSMFFYGCNLGFDETIVMDAIHDVFYKLCISNSSFSTIPNLKFYLFKALKNRLIDIHRVKKDYSGTISTEEGYFHSESESFKLNVTVEDEIIAKEDLREIQEKVGRVLSSLTDRQREIIYLRYIQGYEYKEITELMGISVESCRNLINKSFKKIRMSDIHLLDFFIILKFISLFK